ncbi:MAG: phosphate starvation-inducible protein PhoH [Clostridiales bacterium GWF2_38_85]|nr:MAG: phosphate starvation-inducible protein PhoH [Clostridiales bacterium GWF2_38_85]HBL84079.1 phosphate starvation-inducible protein PhoH [Clostridiales bacterium]
MYEKALSELNPDFITKLFGNLDTNIISLEKAFGVRIINREYKIVVLGEDDKTVQMASNAVVQLQKVTKLSDCIEENCLNYVLNMIKEDKADELAHLYDDCICLTNKGRPVKSRTVGQKKYVDAIKKNTIVFGVGPAGTGKTFLAVAMAVTALKSKQMSRIVLTRPAVEAGERLGFLPGDLQSKIDPYLRPLYDALGEMLGTETFKSYLEKGIIEIAPLAYMRGRTLDDAFIILDEAQNTTPEQMKMFLTRLGNNSKAIVTGDITQIDLPYLKKSGMIEAIRILDNIEGIQIFKFSRRDVVRHPLVQKIIVAYEDFEKSTPEKQHRFTPRCKED